MKKIYFLKIVILLFCIAVIGTMTVFAQSDDDLFFSDDLFEEEIITAENSVPTEPLFALNSVKFGGTVSAMLGSDTAWFISNAFDTQFIKPNLITKLAAQVFFDARPIENQRLYGKLAVHYIPTSNTFDFSVFELFTDFAYKDSIFFRFGKHTIKWGVGYFFSPADILNLTSIDPLEPEKQREGAISLRTHVVFPGTQTNIWLYILPDVHTHALLDTAYAAKAEFVLANTEIGLGGYYTYNTAKEKSPRIVSTVSSTLGGKVSVFAEGVLIFANNEFPLQATLGASYTQQDWKCTFAAQYMYDGFKLSPLHTYHNAVISISKSELFHKKISGSLFAFAALPENSFSQMSISTQAALTVQPFDGCSFSLIPKYTVAKQDNTFLHTAGFSISATLGGGKF